MNTKNEIAFLTSFFSLFEAKIEAIKFDEKNTIYGTLSWEGEEDKQDFRWFNYFNKEALEILKKTCDFLTENNLNDNDKILLPENKLKKELIDFGWSKINAEKGIELLMYINIRMVDDGEETDSFFIHF